MLVGIQPRDAVVVVSRQVAPTSATQEVADDVPCL